VFTALAATAVFRTLRDMNPVLPDVLAVNLEGQHGTLIGSTIMSNLLSILGRFQLIAAALTLVCLALHFLLVDTSGNNLTAALVRIFLALAALGVLLFDRFRLFPRLARHRQTYIDHADEPDTANPAKDAFDKDQHLSLNLLLLSMCLLAGLVLFSASITPKPIYLPVAESSGR
jgi:hypothetical protein